MKIEKIKEVFSICKIPDVSKVNFKDKFCFIGITDQEISLVCNSAFIPENVLEYDSGWRAFRIQGPLDFSMVGVLSSISSLLASERISIFAVSTFDTDYILTKTSDFMKAEKILKLNGHTFSI